MFLHEINPLTRNQRVMQEEENNSSETQALMSDVTQWYNNTRPKDKKKLSLNDDEKQEPQSFQPLFYIQNVRCASFRQHVFDT
jgi:phosphomevalonate kinase